MARLLALLLLACGGPRGPDCVPKTCANPTGVSCCTGNQNNFCVDCHQDGYRYVEDCSTGAAILYCEARGY